MKKVYVPFRYIHIIQQIFTKNNKQTIRIKHLFWKIFVQVAQKEEIYINAIFARDLFYMQNRNSPPLFAILAFKMARP